MTRRWGILGTGAIANGFAATLARLGGARLAAVGSRSRLRAEAFALRHGGCGHASYERLVRDPGVAIVYVALPNHLHCRWVLECLRHGKHVLCEKPLGVDRREAATMIAAARRHRRFLMEAYMYRCHPQIARLEQLLASGRIGAVQLVEARFLTPVESRRDIRFARRGGGAVLDLGGYPISLCRTIARSEPDTVRAVAVRSRGVDAQVSAALRFRTGVTATVSFGLTASPSSAVAIFGTEGEIHLANPWYGDGIIHVVGSRGISTITVKSRRDPYALEALAVERYLAAGQAPAMTWQDSLATAAVLDRIRADIA